MVRRDFQRRDKYVARLPGWLLFVAILLAAGCFSGRQNRGGPKLQGAGSSFVNPLMQKWVSEYGALSPGVRIDYQSIGSGGGIKQLREKTISFAATDIPMRDEELAAAGSEILHIPVVLGAVVITYNLKGVEQPLRLTPDVIADIFLGRITNWNDPRITVTNPDANVPDAPIVVVHRTDGSGTSAVFTNYLSKVSPTWKEQVGEGTAPRFPTGLGGKGNEGASGLIKQTPNSIGYVELAYAVKNNLPVAELRNRAGQFVVPSAATVAGAARATLDQTPADLRVSITDADGENSYPIASYVYVLIYRHQTDEKTGRVITDFLRWGINDGSRFAQTLFYTPLPEEIVRRTTGRLAEVTLNGNSAP